MKCLEEIFAKNCLLENGENCYRNQAHKLPATGLLKTMFLKDRRRRHPHFKRLFPCLHGLDGFLNDYLPRLSSIFFPDHDQSLDILNHYPRLGTN